MSANQNKNTAKYNNKNQNKVPTKVQDVTPWNNSIFIPAIPFAVTKNQLKDAMESNLGPVHRIDFATFNSDNGSGRRAFVHFDHTYQTDFTKVMRQEIAQKGHFDVYYPMLRTNLRIMMNKNPVPETDKTIHQVASEIDFIGEKIRLHEETFVLMQDRMNEMYEKNKALDSLSESLLRLDEENKSMKQFMENMFHSMKAQEAMIQTLVNTVSMQMQPVFMPMPMPMMTGYYPIHQIPMESTIIEDNDYDYEEEDTQGEMHLSELM
jgi:hypothetical protein